MLNLLLKDLLGKKLIKCRLLCICFCCLYLIDFEINFIIFNLIFIFLPFTFSFLSAYFKNFEVIKFRILIIIYFNVNFSENLSSCSMLCADRRCPLSMWLYMTRIRLSFNDKLDYFYDIEHEQGPDLPIQDPFSYYDTPDGIVRTVVSNERSTTLVMAFALLGFFIIWYIGSYLLIMYLY